MKNNLADLNDSLFEMLEKLSDSETLEDEKKTWNDVKTGKCSLFNIFANP